MNLEYQVCTLVQGKTFRQKYRLNLKSHFVWIKQEEYPAYLAERNESEFIISKDGGNFYTYPAPSCAELGVLLPYKVVQERITYIFTIWKVHQQFSCAYENCKENRIHLFDEIIDGEHEAHAKADLLIYLIKEKIINPQDLRL